MARDHAYSVTSPPPGTWILFADHFPRALTPEYTRLYRSTFEEAQSSMYERYGIPFRGLATTVLDGHLYLGPVPLVGGPGAVAPPKPLLWLATRLHPAFRRRRAQARKVLRERPWRDEVHVWRRELRPLWTNANLALQAHEPADLDDEALARHLRQCRSNAEEGYRTHFMLHGPDLLATGLLLARGSDWGLTPHDLLTALVGASPASTGADDDLDVVRIQVAQHSATPTSLDELRAIGPDVAAALDRFLTHHGWRLITSYDIDGRCLIELPELILTLATTPIPPPASDGDAQWLRDRVPAADHAEFDTLLDDARFTYGLRDDNGGITGAWTVGLLRRAILEVGRRLEERGLLATAAHAVEVDADHLLGLLAGADGPTADEVTQLAKARADASRHQPPPQLGAPVPGPEVIAMFPEPLRLIVRSQLALADGSYHGGAAPLTGLGIGTASVTARACVVRDAAGALEHLQPGEVLVTPSTTPAFNAALSIAGGLVVEQGGYLSHAAVTARELGLPAVIGAAGAVAAIPHGSVVCVDPDIGLVRKLDGTAVPHL